MREIDDLQPQEIDLIIKGNDMAEERENRRQAYFTTWTACGPHMKPKSIKFDRILAPLIKKEKESAEELIEEKKFLVNLLQKGR